MSLKASRHELSTEKCFTSVAQMRNSANFNLSEKSLTKSMTGRGLKCDP